ncbi:acyltransferase [Streptomyces sp. NPDC102264]|uniref:acyltransferase n=1 Tax=Streptomyces sp. NPDC102264 TaxID=3366149 RepID=UPI00380D9C9D
MRTDTLLRITIAALMRATDETQTDLGAGIGLSQGQISRKMRADGTGSDWTLWDCDRLAAHYGIGVLDLLAGPDTALKRLDPRRLAATVGSQ